ncbi:MAG TPA: LamG domain-containing protein [Saprospiraceae bacterium]|nr:LamG domain-containing protein [Saprospiraceae bacterium]
MKYVIYTLIFFVCFSNGTKLKAQIPENGLMAYYPFNGNAKDKSGNCINGLVSGAVIVSDRFGRTNSAYLFNGNLDNYIYIPNAEFLQTDEYSYSVWCQLAVLPDEESSFFVMANGSTLHDQIINTVNHGVNQNGWNASGYNLGTPKQFILNSNKDLEINKWIHYVVTRSAKNMKLYLNGNLEVVDSSLNVVYPDYGAPEIYIGKRSNSTYAFHGKIDDIRIYNRAINEKEVKALFNEDLCYENITVTDTLIINANLTSFNPINYKINIKVYPNPTLDHLIIDCGNIIDISGYSFKISNTSGIEVFQSLIDKSQFDLNMNNWTGKGLYLLYLYDAKSQIIDIKKIVLQ